MKSEDRLTISVADYIRLQYPKVLFTHIANERKTSAIYGHKLKRMGVRAGLPDLLIFEFSKDHSGLAIELKVGKNKPTELQLFALKELERCRWSCHVCYSFDSAKEIIDDYLYK